MRQLPAEELAKYFERKATEIEENLIGKKVSNHTRKGKQKMVIGSSPSGEIESSKQLRRRKKEAEKRKKAAEKQKQMEDIDNRMRALAEQKAELQCGGKVKEKLLVQSPRESSKGGHSKRTLVPIDTTKGTNVCLSNGAMKWRFASVDSSTPSLPGSHIISDPHAIGIWDSVKDVPPCEINELGQPIGHFWEHMQSYTHQGSMAIPMGETLDTTAERIEAAVCS